LLEPLTRAMHASRQKEMATAIQARHTQPAASPATVKPAVSVPFPTVSETQGMQQPPLASPPVKPLQELPRPQHTKIAPTLRPR